MRHPSIAAIFAALILSGCGTHKLEHHDIVTVRAYASNPTPTTADTIALSAILTSEGRVYLSATNWVFSSGPTTPWIRTPSSNQTIVSFTDPGIYSFTYRVFWWDSSNNRREDEDSVSVEVLPVGNG